MLKLFYYCWKLVKRHFFKLVGHYCTFFFLYIQSFTFELFLEVGYFFHNRIFYSPSYLVTNENSMYRGINVIDSKH